MNDAQYKLIVDAARKRGAIFPRQEDWLEFKAAIDAAVNDNPDPILPIDLAAFFDAMRGSKVLGPTLSDNEVQGCEAVIAAYAGFPASWTAYGLATAFHETAGTMQPIREYGRGKGRKYGKPGKHGGQVAYGRGFVQLTWDYNYEKADAELGLKGALLANYDLALEPAIAAQILRRGMAEGWFTGKKLGDYLPASGTATLAQFTEARRIVNGTDRAALIAGHALEFQRALIKGSA